MTKPPRPLRDGGRLDELILNAVLGQTWQRKARLRQIGAGTAKGGPR